MSSCDCFAYVAPPGQMFKGVSLFSAADGSPPPNTGRIYAARGAAASAAMRKAVSRSPMTT